MKNTIFQCLTNAYGPDCYVEETDGGWIISVVNQILAQDPNRYNQVIDRIDRHLQRAMPRQPVVIVYKLFIYENVRDQYCVEATMHTRESDYVDNMHTTYVNADDAYVLLRQVDSEYLMLQGERGGYEAKMINANLAGLNLHPANQRRYVELEFNGFFAHHFLAAPTTNKIEADDIWAITFNPPS